MKNYKLRAWGADHLIRLEIGRYSNNGNLAIEMYTDEGEPWSSLTVNLYEKLPPDYAYVDINDNGNEIITWIQKNGIGEPTGRVRSSGFCIFPEVKFNLDSIKS